MRRNQLVGGEHALVDSTALLGIDCRNPRERASKLRTVSPWTYAIVKKYESPNVPSVDLRNGRVLQLCGKARLVEEHLHEPHIARALPQHPLEHDVTLDAGGTSRRAALAVERVA